ncbi:GH92 family glycosyl hydrolase [Lysinibacter sp. HNR]|uniref:GH92 family glycosyl hydrolase n=1 Tax=Lysinibacter sp. HNR TaxID=3031408 RepID=UPI002435E201|nr:GH92 family glycosyl hydrolase [Lysinibacter sp. HNR]WGD37465.1 GH92 family glycosyl hydrolase [Lysinibacter sp. HNR]
MIPPQISQHHALHTGSTPSVRPGTAQPITSQPATARPNTSRRFKPLAFTAALSLLIGGLGGIAGGTTPAAATPTTPAAPATPAASENLAALVNPFVGTESEGNAYPGATVPFGMVQLSPDNSSTFANTSYSNNAGRVWGFSHRHINSAGCPAAGEVLVSPSTTDAPTSSRVFTGITPYTERASAGQYSVKLDNNVQVDLTATERVGVHRYTFLTNTVGHISFNVGQTLRSAGESSITWVDDSTLEGWVYNGGFCGSGGEKAPYFFSAQFDRPARTTWVWGEDAALTSLPSSTVASGHNGAAATFDTYDDQDVEVRVGVSFVSVDGARANRLAETVQNGNTLSFDDTVNQAVDAWNDRLGKIDVTTQNDSQRKIFYTQLYKSFLSPTIGSDVDGFYRGMDLNTHVADDWTYYQTFSLWDTYRSQATLHALLAADTAKDIVRSMFHTRIEGGWLPRWSLGSLETNIMAGDPVTPWIAENFALGTVPDDIADELWDYLIENATTAPPAGVASVGRQSAEFYNEHGHIPFHSELVPGLGQQYEEYRHGGSSTMEFALSDASVGAAAERLGLTETAAEFRERGKNWRNLWNPDVALSGGFTGIVNAVTPDHQFVPVAEKADVKTSGFHEGTQWQYQWMTPQDVGGLIDKMGGADRFSERLDYYFNTDALTQSPGISPSSWAPGGSSYYTSIGYNPGNEPTIGNPWLYNYIGQPTKTSDVLAANLNRYPNTPGGGVGNDDLGTLASWYVMASLGFQPVVPGSGILALNAPKVSAATVRFDSGEILTITAPGARANLPDYVSALSINGSPHTANWVDVSHLQNGGSLDFTLSTSPAHLTWGTAEADRVPDVVSPEYAEAIVTPNTNLTAVAGEEAVLELASVITNGADVGDLHATVEWTSISPDNQVEAGIQTAAQHSAQTVAQHSSPATIVRTEHGWSVFTTHSFADEGAITATVTVRSTRSTPAFAPNLMEPARASVSVFVHPSGGTSPLPRTEAPKAAPDSDKALPQTGTPDLGLLGIAALLLALTGGFLLNQRSRRFPRKNHQ